MIELMLDSGAFSAWQRGETINVRDYIRFLKQFKHLLSTYINLDVIPGVPNTIRTSDQVEASAKASFKNFETMKAAGLNPIPVIHHGEHFSWLEKLLKMGETYIGISPSKDVNIRQQSEWLNQFFSILTNSDGRPFVKIHCFGITKTSMMLRYPFYSVDSTTWCLTPGYGVIIAPSLGSNGQLDYLHPTRIITSGVQQENSRSHYRQFEAMGERYQKAVLRFLDEEVGCTIGHVRYGTSYRRKAALIYFMKMCEQLGDIRFKERHQGFISRQQFMNVDKLKPIKQEPIRFIFATQPENREYSHLMNEVKANRRLVSYYRWRNDRPADIEEYCRRGIVGSYKRKPPKIGNNETYLNWRRLQLIDHVIGLGDGTETTSG